MIGKPLLRRAEKTNTNAKNINAKIIIPQTGRGRKDNNCEK
jgi:hypothetical protein